MKICKYPIPIPTRPDGKVGVELPKGAHILSVGEQNRELYLWAQVDLRAENELRLLSLVGTGHEFNFIWRKFLGTIIMKDLPFVWHVFEVVE